MICPELTLPRSPGQRSPDWRSACRQSSGRPVSGGPDPSGVPAASREPMAPPEIAALSESTHGYTGCERSIYSLY